MPWMFLLGRRNQIPQVDVNTGPALGAQMLAHQAAELLRLSEIDGVRVHEVIERGDHAIILVAMRESFADGPSVLEECLRFGALQEQRLPLGVGGQDANRLEARSNRRLRPFQASLGSLRDVIVVELHEPRRLVEKTLVLILGVDAVAGRQRILERELGLMPLPLLGRVHILHERALPATLLSKRAAELIAGAQGLRKVVIGADHHAMAHAVVARLLGFERQEAVLSPVVADLGGGLIGDFSRAQSVLKESVHAAVIVGSGTERERLGRRSEDHRRLVPDVVGYVMTVHRGRNVATILQQREDLERSARAMLGGDGVKSGQEAREVVRRTLLLDLRVDLLELVRLRRPESRRIARAGSKQDSEGKHAVLRYSAHHKNSSIRRVSF